MSTHTGTKPAYVRGSFLAFVSLLFTSSAIAEPETEKLVAATEPRDPQPSLLAAAPLVVEKRPLPLAFWFASGTAVVGLGIGTTFTILGKSERNTTSDCAPNCDSDRRSAFDNPKRDYWVADVGFAVSAVSLSVATWLLLSSASGTTEQPTVKQYSQSAISRLIPTCGVTNNGGVLSWSGSF